MLGEGHVDASPKVAQMNGLELSSQPTCGGRVFFPLLIPLLVLLLLIIVAGSVEVFAAPKVGLDQSPQLVVEEQ